MMNIKEWIEEGTAIKTANTAFKKSVQLPFIIFIDKQEFDGHDVGNCIVEHDLTVEYYADVINEEDELKIENLFHEIPVEFIKDRLYIDSERMFMTIYSLSIKERMRNNEG